MARSPISVVARKSFPLPFRDRYSIGLPDSGRSSSSAQGRTALVDFGALPDLLANIGQSDLCLFGQLQGIINFDAEVAHGAFELGVPKQ